MWKQRRICNYYDLPEFKLRVILEYGNFVQSKINEGRTPYLITFMFNNILGGTEPTLNQMEDEVQRVFSTFITRVVRNPGQHCSRGYCQLFLVVPIARFEKK